MTLRYRTGVWQPRPDTGAVVALVGAGLALTVIRLGAEDGTVGFTFDGRISRIGAVTVRPVDYEGDATSLMWVATITAPGPGHWPLVLILLLGALPGVAIVTDTAHLRHGWR